MEGRGQQTIRTSLTNKQTLCRLSIPRRHKVQKRCAQVISELA